MDPCGGLRVEEGGRLGPVALVRSPRRSNPLKDMPTPSERPTPRRIEFESDEFQDLVEIVEKCFDARQSLGIVFLGGRIERWREAVAALEEPARPNVYQYDMARFIGERAVETQGNIREVFDRVGGEPALLLFVNGDALFKEGQSGGAEKDAITPADYLLQRVAAFEGVSVLCVLQEDVLERREASALEAVVQF